MSILPFLLGMAILLLLSAFFSGSETALFSLTAIQVHQLHQSRHRVSHLVARLLHEPEALLVTLLICNMVINVIYFTLASVAALAMQRDPTIPTWQVSLWALGALVVLVLFGEVTPKVLSFSYNQKAAALAALPLYVVHQALRPINHLLRGLLVRPLTRLARPQDHTGRLASVDEIDDLLEVSQRRGVLHADETVMLHEVLALSTLKVRDIMVPRVQMVHYDVQQPIEQLHEQFRHSGRSKVVVCDGDLDHILGWAYAKRVFLNPGRPVREILAPPHYTAELATGEQLLLEFRRNRIGSAIVVDEFGGTAGLVTLHDVLEEIVGEIRDAQAPADQPLAQQIGPSQYLVSGQLPIHDWADTFGHEMDDPRLITVGGLVIHLLGRLPRVGDTCRYRNIRFTVESMHGRRIERLRLDVQPPGEASP